MTKRVFVVLLGMAIATGAIAQTRRPAEQPLPPAVQVCLLEGRLAERPAMAAVSVPRVGLATPSRAGVYDPTAPIDTQLLNWTVPDVGCVSDPHHSTQRNACGVAGGAALPVVRRVLCQQ